MDVTLILRTSKSKFPAVPLHCRTRTHTHTPMSVEMSSASSEAAYAMFPLASLCLIQISYSQKKKLLSRHTHYLAAPPSPHIINLHTLQPPPATLLLFLLLLQWSCSSGSGGLHAAPVSGRGGTGKQQKVLNHHRSLLTWCKLQTVRSNISNQSSKHQKSRRGLFGASTLSTLKTVGPTKPHTVKTRQGRPVN